MEQLEKNDYDIYMSAPLPTVEEEGMEAEEGMEVQEEGDWSGEEFNWSDSEEMTEEGGHLAAQVCMCYYCRGV